MSDSNLNKNTLIEASLGSKDENNVEGIQVDRISKSQVTNIIQNFQSNPTGMELLFTNIFTRIEKLEKNSYKTKTGKKDKYRKYVPIKLATKDIHPDILRIIDAKKKESINIKVVYELEILNKYEYVELEVDKTMRVGQTIKRRFRPECIIFIPQSYYPEFKKLISDIKDFRYY